MAEIIGQPFGYQIEVKPGAGPGVGVTPLPKGRVMRSTVAEAGLHIDAPLSWAGIDAGHQLWSQTAPAPVLGVAPTNSRRFAYCATGSIRTTSDGGAIFSDVPTDGMASALAGTTYQPLGPSSPACSALALDPGRPTIYAAVTVNPNGQAPPFETVGMITTDGGRHWSLLPTPPGSSPGLFSDFRADAAGVDAVFNLSGPDSGGGPYSAGGAPSVVVERTTDGGASWTPSRLACPASGPCVTFGGPWDGNCAMNGSLQAVQYSMDAGATWSSPAWPSRVNSCGSPQLAATSDGAVILVDPASGYLVRRSSDGGRSWSYIGTPALPGTSPGQVDVSGGVALLPDGDLLFVGGGGPWYLLAKGSGSWCRVQQKAGAIPHQMFVDGSPVVIGGRLWWLQSDRNSPSQPTPGSRPLSSLTCST